MLKFIFFCSDDAVLVKKVNCINGALKRSERFLIHFIVHGNKSSHVNYIHCSLMQNKKKIHLASLYNDASVTCEGQCPYSYIPHYVMVCHKLAQHWVLRGAPQKQSSVCTLLLRAWTTGNLAAVFHGTAGK